MFVYLKSIDKNYEKVCVKKYLSRLRGQRTLSFIYINVQEGAGSGDFLGCRCFRTSEKQNMRLWLMYHIMDPSSALLNSNRTPFTLRHQMCFWY